MTSVNDLNGKTVVVTGAGSGIGRATALAFAQAGATVAVTDIDLDAARQVCSAAAGNAKPFLVDVASASSVDDMFDAILSDMGGLDIAVNNAGISSDVNLGFADTTEAEFDRMIAINFKGVWLCMKRELEIFRGSGRDCAIVNTASMLGLVGARNMPVYSATKHAIVGLTRSAALEFARRRVRINAVCPGGIETPLTGKASYDEAGLAMLAKMHPVGRMGTSEEIANAIVWLASPAASFVTGATLAVDGGMTAS